MNIHERMKPYLTEVNVEPEREWEQRVFEFPNGWGASVVRGHATYGGSEGLWELAVRDEGGEVDYTTRITSDVIGHLTDDEVNEHLERIKALPPKGMPDMIPRSVMEDWLADVAILSKQSPDPAVDGVLTYVVLSGHAALVKYDRAKRGQL